MEKLNALKLHPKRQPFYITYLKSHAKMLEYFRRTKEELWNEPFQILEREQNYQDGSDSDQNRCISRSFDDYDHDDSFVARSEDEELSQSLNSDVSLSVKKRVQGFSETIYDSECYRKDQKERVIQPKENIPINSNVETQGLDDLENLLQECGLGSSTILPASMPQTPPKINRTKKRPQTERTSRVIGLEKEKNPRNITGRRFREQRDDLTRKLFSLFNKNIFSSKLPGFDNHYFSLS